MRVYVPSMEEFFNWAYAHDQAYSVLRGFGDFEASYPAPLAKADVDLLVSDSMGAAIKLKYGRYTKAQGTKCDVYTVSGDAGTDYLGFPYFPVGLAQTVLAERRLWRNRFF